MKVYGLEFWNDDAWMYLLDENEVYATEESAKSQKMALFLEEKGKEYKCDWFYLMLDNGDTGIRVISIEVKP